jgi:hypothetical protein
LEFLRYYYVPWCHTWSCRISCLPFWVFVLLFPIPPFSASTSPFGMGMFTLYQCAVEVRSLFFILEVFTAKSCLELQRRLWTQTFEQC